MNDTSPNTPRIAFVSALFGILALVVALWALGFGFLGALVTGVIVAAIVWAILWMGWSAPQGQAADAPVNTGVPRVAPAASTAPTAASAAPAPVSTAPVAAQKPLTSEKAAKNPASKPAAAIPAAKAETAKAAVKPAAKPAAAKAKKAGDKPAVLKKPRDGGPDDLKMIKGVGPVLEKALHAAGVFHFDQIAAWKKADATWFDDNVKGANGRVMRDEWVSQAKILAKGGTTEFASKVKKGGVY
uniref:NADH:quinone oxidoreductase n=1 Tax=Yoonia sp. TaxID=2212373 RepID=UPI004048BE40